MRYLSLFIKRLFDIFLATTLLCLLAPILLLLTYKIRKNLGTPVIFKQERAGKNGKPFMMYKFRSMSDAKDANGNLLSDAERLTDFGKKLRASSLDELPELWNVLKGDMSLVGPRPLLMEYLPLYSPEQFQRHNMKPGITGWAQINGRNAISWEERFQLDLWYIRHFSFLLDIKILYLTLHKTLNKADISAQGEATMPKFTGNQAQGNPTRNQNEQ